MWDDDTFDDLEDGEWPVIEIAPDDPSERKGGGFLKVLLIILVLGIVAAAGFFLVQHLRHVAEDRNNVTLEIASEPVEEVPPEPELVLEEVEEVPVATPEPTPEPTPPPIPEEYQIPGVEEGDLAAVHDYVQAQLIALAESPDCPNIRSIAVNDDCTVFTVVCNTINETAVEREAAEEFYRYGRMYAAHARTEAGNIHIDYVNFYGNLLWVRDSEG